VVTFNAPRRMRSVGPHRFLAKRP